ncbi:gamma-type small acid-soluble spore protein [Lihuaxuella thermophila]|uniref:Small, acid-soluble spore protein gamma-type n=1 Tax=Lihuaxuella thermophila TaxID=1173111 RepID=A0A1H8ANR2_9BACL|nr:gamma-type small acid-soluble spore protein [Lihuaxuella thermophila]SEM72321.1 small acid-soluble spore protein E (minor gamma-type SASP) [Lihuaxuella thermophila]
MPQQQQPQASKTNAQQVRQQNQAAAQSPGGYQSKGAQNAQFEFASETNAQAVRQKNAQSQARKNQNQF